MYSNNQKTQSNECLICFEPLLKEISFVHILKSLPICYQCLNKFEVLNIHTLFHHHPLQILYFYNEFFQSLLYQYKGLYDYALKDTFLCLFSDELIRKYSNYVIVVAPSSKEDNLVRGFSPMESIAKTIWKNVFTGLYKNEKYKQSDLRYEDREKMKKKIGIRHGEQLKGKKVLILDDVVTSGNTLSTCLSLVLLQNPQCVELLVLSTRKNKEAFTS